MDIEETDLCREYQTISCELRALAKMVKKEFGNEEMGEIAVAAGGDVNACRSPLFERGRFYEEYAARRNERLRRRKREKAGGGGEEKKSVYDLGVRVDSVKRRGEAKKYKSGRKSAVLIPSTPVAERREAPATTSSRYLLRSTSSKENKKPPMVTSTPSASTERTGARRARRL